MLVISQINGDELCPSAQFHELWRLWLYSQCFFCNTEDEFDLLCQLIQKRLVHPEKQPLFELCNERPRHWSPLEDGAEEALGATAFLGKFVRPRVYTLLNLRVEVRIECSRASDLCYDWLRMQWNLIHFMFGSLKILYKILVHFTPL